MADPKANKLVRTLTGKVVSKSGDKTVIVLIVDRVKHPLYGKVIKKSHKYAAHDGTNQHQEGDIVTIAESRPISKTKSWVVISSQH